jgi:hypothetical protein
LRSPGFVGEGAEIKSAIKIASQIKSKIKSKITIKIKNKIMIRIRIKTKIRKSIRVGKQGTMISRAGIWAESGVTLRSEREGEKRKVESEIHSARHYMVIGDYNARGAGYAQTISGATGRAAA